MAQFRFNISGARAADNIFSTAALAAIDTRDAPTYCCPECGSEVPRDALVLTCRCAQDFEVPSGVDPGSVVMPLAA